MKNKLFVAGIVMIFLVLVHCEKESTIYLTHIKTEAGGCNNADFSDLKIVREAAEDTLLFSITQDTLDIFVGINYICCAPFQTLTQVTADSILISITDACSPDGELCYCRCMCYYIWDFLFVDFENKSYAFKITLVDPRQTKPSVLWQGTVDLSTHN